MDQATCVRPSKPISRLTSDPNDLIHRQPARATYSQRISERPVRSELRDDIGLTRSNVRISNWKYVWIAQVSKCLCLKPRFPRGEPPSTA